MVIPFETNERLRRFSDLTETLALKFNLKYRMIS
jgi:hypothetical protein